MSPNTKTILATAYAVNPYKGSEDGMGWNFILQIARFNKVIAITRENNQGNIEKFMAENPDPLYNQITFMYYDLPPHLRWWKKGSRGALLYYQLWQRGVVNFVKKQHLTFDIAHNVNFHNDWTPTFLWKLGKPLVWGPVGHHSRIPVQYLRDYAFSYKIKETFTWAIKKYFWNFSPNLKKAVRHADHILCMNKSVQKEMHLNDIPVTWMPSVAMHRPAFVKSHDDKAKFTIISAGRLVPLKGFDLTIRAFAHFLECNPHVTDTELMIIGSGPEKSTLKEIAGNEKLGDKVKFIDWIERDTLLELYSKASVFLFPSHEGAGMVVAEALSYGLPVICLDNDGPGEFICSESGISVPLGEYKQTTKLLGNALHTLYHDKPLYQKMSESAIKRFEAIFDWNKRGEKLNDIYQSLQQKTI